MRKTVFDTLKEVRRRAHEINFENKSNKDKTRMRGYQCEKSNKFHLTSMSHTSHKFYTDKSFRKKKKFQSFLRKEVEYWTNKLDIK